MQRRDGTGPMGIGPTGRGLGYCNPTNSYFGNRVGYGCRGGMGGGFGFRQNVGVNFAEPASQKELLTEEKKFLESRLNAISKQLESE